MADFFNSTNLSRHDDGSLTLTLEGIDTSYLQNLTLTGAYILGGKPVFQFKEGETRKLVSMIAENSVGNRQAWLELITAESLTLKDEKGNTTEAVISESAYGLAATIKTVVKTLNESHSVNNVGSKAAITESMRRLAGFIE